jgi:hypothetical protein
MILPITPASSAGPDLKPPQVTIDFIFAPSPLIQDQSARLFYEMVISNYVPITYTMESIGVDCGSQRFS